MSPSAFWRSSQHSQVRRGYQTFQRDPQQILTFASRRHGHFLSKSRAVGSCSLRKQWHGVDTGLSWDVALLQYPELFNICSCQLADWKKCISNASAHCLSTSLFCCDSYARHSTGPLFRKVSNADKALCHHGSGLLLSMAIKWVSWWLPVKLNAPYVLISN